MLSFVVGDFFLIEADDFAFETDRALETYTEAVVASTPYVHALRDFRWIDRLEMRHLDGQPEPEFNLIEKLFKLLLSRVRLLNKLEVRWEMGLRVDNLYDIGIPVIDLHLQVNQLV